MKFSGLTQKGREYLAKVQTNGTPIQFTKIKIGNAKLTEDENPANLMDIKNIKEEKSILEKEINGDATVLVTIIDNSNLQEGYFPRETGIYVQDEEKEILYYYINDGDETSWIPPYSDGPHRMELKINLISSSTGSVIVNDDGSQVFVTREFIEKHYLQKGTFTGTAGELENRLIGLAGKQNGKFPLSSATKGNVYLLEQTQKFYVCTQNYSGTKISVPNSNFTELSVYENMNRLENLSKMKAKIILNVPRNSGARSFQIPKEYGDYTFFLVSVYTLKPTFFDGESCYLVSRSTNNYGRYHNNGRESNYDFISVSSDGIIKGNYDDITYKITKVVALC